MNFNVEYTTADHAYRDSDQYAAGKYRLTARWLERSRSGPGDLFHIGCGTGVFNRTATELGYSVRAFEPDPVAAEIARSRAPRGCVVESHGLQEIAGDGVADVIVMHDVLEHISDDAMALSHLRRLLRDDGLLVISVPALPCLFGYHDEQLGHYRRYTRRSLVARLQVHFTVDACRSYGMMFIPITWLVSRRLRRPYPTKSVGSGFFVGGIVRLLCWLESVVPTPIGTSLVIRARPRPIVSNH